MWHNSLRDVYYAAHRIPLIGSWDFIHLYEYLADLGSISMNFLGGLARTRPGHDYLFVVADQFSKMVRPIP